MLQGPPTGYRKLKVNNQNTSLICWRNLSNGIGKEIVYKYRFSHYKNLSELLSSGNNQTSSNFFIIPGE